MNVTLPPTLFGRRLLAPLWKGDDYTLLLARLTENLENLPMEHVVEAIWEGRQRGALTLAADWFAEQSDAGREALLTDYLRGADAGADAIVYNPNLHATLRRWSLAPEQAARFSVLQRRYVGRTLATALYLLLAEYVNTQISAWVDEDGDSKDGLVTQHDAP